MPKQTLERNKKTITPNNPLTGRFPMLPAMSMRTVFVRQSFSGVSKEVFEIELLRNYEEKVSIRSELCL